jgi:spore photoproduct lyase
MNEWFPERVFVEGEVRNHERTKDILARLPGIPVETVSGAAAVAARFALTGDPVSCGKKSLYVARQRGPFVKPCPCAPGHVRCGYLVVNLDLQCPLDCSYCILQHYLDPPVITIHVNREDLWPELDRTLESRDAGLLRIGTGELGDSLALDHLTGNARPLIEYFRGKQGVAFELKTKTVNVANVLEAEPADNVVVSWSLNAEAAAAVEERDAPAVTERLEAAGRVSERGFPVGFHFDPLIFGDGWEAGYRAVVRRMLGAVRPGRIAWISLGGLRFHPDLKAFIRRRFPRSRITGQEFVRGKDGKFRYFRPARIELYRRVLEMIRESGGEEVPVYLCMETAEVWDRVFGGESGQKKGERKLARSSFPRPKLDQNHLCRWA